jgi:4-hydroxyphenylpyruvate dioxygenase
MTAPDGLIRIPLNEESGKGGSGQIEEFLMKFNGEGIQHIALLTDDLMASVDALQMAGVPLMTRRTASTTDARGATAGSRRAGARTCRARHLVGRLNPGWRQAPVAADFSETLLGPVFFEFISARTTRASAKATSRRCSNRSSATSFGAAR